MEGLAAELPAKPPKDFYSQTGSARVNRCGWVGKVTSRLLRARGGNGRDGERKNELSSFSFCLPLTMAGNGDVPLFTSPGPGYDVSLWGLLVKVT